MSDLWQRMDLSGGSPQPVGNPTELPKELRGLEDPTLADLGAVFGSDQPSLANVGYWPVTKPPVAPPLGYQVADTFTRLIDTDAKTVTVTHGTVTMALDSRKGVMASAVKSKAAALIAAGFAYTVPGDSAHTYQIRDQDQGNMLAVQSRFQKGGTGHHGGYWRSAANANVVMTDAQVQTFFDAAYDYKMAIIRRVQALIDAIAAAASHTALDLIDIEAGTISGAGGWTA